jgi:hypothetical protein
MTRCSVQDALKVCRIKRVRYLASFSYYLAHLAARTCVSHVGLRPLFTRSARSYVCISFGNIGSGGTFTFPGGGCGGPDTQVRLGGLRKDT